MIVVVVENISWCFFIQIICSHECNHYRYFVNDINCSIFKWRHTRVQINSIRIEFIPRFNASISNADVAFNTLTVRWYVFEYLSAHDFARVKVRDSPMRENTISLPEKEWSGPLTGILGFCLIQNDKFFALMLTH